MKLATAFIAAIFAVTLAGVAPASAGDQAPRQHTSAKKYTKKYTHSHHKRTPRVAGWLSRGGYLFGDQNVPFVYAEGRNPDSAYFDTRSFGERVTEGPFNGTR
jgi:hypothetical protein